VGGGFPYLHSAHYSIIFFEEIKKRFMDSVFNREERG
jgi:hypothetical protein